MTAIDTHTCPGCARPHINPNRLACTDCWHRLPRSIRGAVVASWGRAGGRTSPMHRRAVDRALAWYRENGGPR